MPPPVDRAVTTPVTHAPFVGQGSSWYRWIVLGVAWFALLMSVVDRIAWSNVSAVAGRDLGLDPIVALGVFATASHLGFLVAAIGGGVLVDWIGPRRMLGAAIGLLGTLTIAFGFSGSVGQGIVLQFLMGLCAGPAFALGVKLISVWFGRIGRATAMGVFMTATSLAVVVVNMAVPTIQAAGTWRTAFVVLGVVTLATGLLAFAVTRDAPGAKGSSAPLGQLSFDYVMPLLRNRNFRLLAIANFGGPWGTWGFAIWASTLLIDRFGITVAQAGAIVASFGAGAVVAKLLIGILSDLAGGRRKMLTISCLLTFIVGLLAFGALGTLSAFQLLAPLIGIVAFAYSPLLNTMIAESAGDRAGSAAGLSLVLTTAGDSLQPLIIGLIYHYSGSFFLTFALLAAGPMLAVAAMAFVREDAPTQVNADE